MITEKIIENETKKFMECCYRDDVENLENNLLNYGIDLVNSPEVPINVAVKENNFKTIRWLLKNGADTTHMISIKKLKVLIKCGLKPTRYHLISVIKSERGLIKKYKAIELLLKSGAKPDIYILNMVDDIPYLFELISEYTDFNEDSFYIAIRLGSLKLVDSLYRANYNNICLNPQYSVNYNVRMSHDEVMKIGYRDPLLVAYHCNQHHIIDYLISIGAENDRRVLIVNKKNGNIEMRRLSI